MSKKWWALFSVACGAFMATLDASIVNIALSTLTVDLNSSLSEVKWVVVIYFLVLTCLLLPLGKISDSYGRKKIFSSGYVVFILGSALCGFAQSLSWLILFRVIQATGASMLMANGPAIITDAFPAKERGRALGTLAMIVSVGLISGPAIGGILIDSLGWKSIFLLNIPVGILGTVLVKYFVDEDPNAGKKLHFDWAGTILQFLALFSLTVIFDSGKIFNSSEFLDSIAKIGLTFFTAGFFILFYNVEKNAKSPIFDLSLLENKTFLYSNIAALLVFISYSALAVLIPYFLQSQIHLSAHHTGLLMTSIPALILISAPISGRISDNIGSRGLCMSGSLIIAIVIVFLGSFLNIWSGSVSGEILAALGLACIGIGLGLFQTPNNNAIMNNVPSHKLGVASALIATIRNMGIVIGSGLGTGLFTWQQSLTHNSSDSIRWTLVLISLFAFGAVFASSKNKKGPLWS